ncbi:MAG: amidohydrolase [Candidatus Hodarchaeota archaeon]
MTKNVIEWLETNKEKFFSISDQIWNYAEIGLLEKESSNLLANILEEAEFEVERGVAYMPTAFIARYGTEKPVIAILGEYDALPGLSQTTEPIKKPIKDGSPGHGCGHNLLGVAALAAVLAIKELIKSGDVTGTICFYGCPAEENVDAKAGMVKEGYFKDIDISLTWHPDDKNSVWSINFQAIFSAVFKFHGRTAHAAADPFNGRSALDAVELMNVGCNYLREHIIPDARIHYTITNGGEAPNIVPADAAVWYFIRAPRIDQVREIYPRVVKVAEGAALMTETELEIKFHGGSANMLPNYVLEDLIYQKMNELGPPPFDSEDQRFSQEIQKTFPEGYFDNFLSIMPRDMQEVVEQFRGTNLCDKILPIVGRGYTMPGSTDVGDVSWVTPLVQFSSACYTIGTPGHSWQLVAQVGMSIGHKGMLHAAKALALTSFELMQKPEIVKKARKEFDERIKGTSYESALPDDWRPPIEHIREIYNK